MTSSGATAKRTWPPSAAILRRQAGSLSPSDQWLVSFGRSDQFGAGGLKGDAFESELCLCEEMSELDGQSGSLQAELEQHARDEKSLLEGMQEARQIRQRASRLNEWHLRFAAAVFSQVNAHDANKRSFFVLPRVVEVMGTKREPKSFRSTWE